MRSDAICIALALASCTFGVPAPAPVAPHGGAHESYAGYCRTAAATADARWTSNETRKAHRKAYASSISLSRSRSGMRRTVIYPRLHSPTNIEPPIKVMVVFQDWTQIGNPSRTLTSQ